MVLLNQLFKTPAENLACDEALLELSESGADREILRLWQPKQPFVVLGLSNSAAAEVNLPACRKNKIPILRRFSGGGTVLQLPGCLNFSLILRIVPGPLATITGTTRWVLERHKQLFTTLTGSAVAIEGTSDLTIAGRKFSGHAQRRKRRFVLFHGSILLKADLSLIEKVLLLPAKQPAYRQNRSHSRFLANLNLPAGAVSAALQQAWGATEVLGRLPTSQIKDLLRTRYTNYTWNYRL